MISIAKPIIYGPAGQVLSSRAGYGDAGASYRKRALKAFLATSGDVTVDIDPHNQTLRQRSRMLNMSGGMAASAIRTNRTNVVGCGLDLKARLNRELLGMDAEEANRIEKRIEAEFGIWARDKRACDATGVNDFYAMQQLALTSWLLSGDCFVLFKHKEPERMRPYSLRLHILEADRISTPMLGTGIGRGAISVDGTPIHYRLGLTEGTADNGNLIHDGVEVDGDGAIVAYHICSQYPVGNNWLSEKPEWTRVEAYGQTSGRPNILQVMDAERPEQYRGIPYLANVIEQLLQSRRYTESELMAAVVESFFTAFIKTETTQGEDPFNEVGNSIDDDPRNYEMGPGVINYMKPGEDIEFASPNRPASGFPNFMRAMAEQVGATLEIPADLLLKSFNSSYSASRAAILEAWKAFKMRRTWFVSDFCQPTYEEWLDEAVARGRIEAPGYFDDPLTRAAWLGAEWIGPAAGQLDPVKEVTAKVMAIKEGLTTREQATTEMGNGSWDDNVRQIAIENQRIAEANAPLEESGGSAGQVSEPVPDAVAHLPDARRIMFQMMKDAMKEELEDAEPQKE